MTSSARKMAAAVAAGATVLAGLALAPTAIAAPPADSPSADAPSRGQDPAEVAAVWTPAARAAAIPRDLVIDERGLGYLKGRDGSLEPYGHAISARAHDPAVADATVTVDASPKGSKPAKRRPPGGGGSKDTTPPVIGAMDPDAITIGSPYTFTAEVTDDSSVAVQFLLTFPNGASAVPIDAYPSGSTYSRSIGSLTDGTWQWVVEATDSSGNTSTSSPTSFTVSTTPVVDPPTDPNQVTNGDWTGGKVQTAAGRIYFEMPTNRRLNRWSGYVCSGTAVTDGAGDASVILTAAHCVYDDANKAFARNVMFIPNQAGTTGTRTDDNCDNDPIGCWAPSYGVVDTNWTQHKFPDNIPWDYGYYVVPATGSHTQKPGGTASDSLEEAAGTLPVSWTAPTTGGVAAALGYSYSEDPKFKYCQEGLGTIDSNLATGPTTNWWLAHCGLSGGASGGPWLQKPGAAGGVDGDNGPIVSVNSWGYSNQPGMAGPNLATSSARCVKSLAESKSGSGRPSSRGYVFSGSCL